MRVTQRYFTALLALLALFLGQFPVASLPAAAAEPPQSEPTVSTPTTIDPPSELRVGSTVSLTVGSWDANPAASYSNQWFSCTNLVAAASLTIPSGCTAITGATAQILTVSGALKSKFLVAAVTATNSVNPSPGVTSYSASTQTSVTPAPQSTLTVTGTGGTIKFTSAATATLNTKFAVDLTSWIAAPTYSYKWFRCAEPTVASANEPTGCSVIAATTSTYTVTAADVGNYVVPYVTALSGATVLSTARIASRASTLQVPVLSNAASVSGAQVAVGKTLTALNGTWSATPAPSFTYQWYSCTTAVVAAATKNAVCSVLSGETQNTYVPDASQGNKFIVVQVKAANSANVGSPASSYSASTTKVLTPPSLTSAPTLSYSSLATTGQPVADSTVTARTGTWAGSPAPTKTFQWYLCDAPVNAGALVTPPGCDSLAGSTAATINPLSAWQGKYLTVAEIATNEVASAQAFAGANESVQSKPVFDSDPSISGVVKSGQTVTANPNWSVFGGEPTAEYQWFQCTSAQSSAVSQPAACRAIAGESSRTMVVGTGMEENYLSVRVTLVNPAGTTTRFSATTVIVVGDIVNLTAQRPLSSAGRLRVGTAVRASDTTWSGYPRPTFTTAWFRCDAPVLAKSSSAPAGCTAIPSANQLTYLPVRADSGKYLSVRTVAVQGLTLVPVWSPTGEQVFEAPSFDSPPSVGSQHVLGGSLLNSSVGLVRGLPEVARTYAWYRCSNVVNGDSDSLASGCVLIQGAVSATYEFVSADVGKYVLTAVTITNELGSARRFTPSSAMVNSGPENVSIIAPTSGALTLKVGNVVTANDGVWTALPAPTFTYQWYRCYWNQAASATAQNGCTAISGASSKTYLLSIADAGFYISVAVRAQNPYSSSIVYSPSTSDVGEDISYEDEPKLNDSRSKGQTLTTRQLEIRGTPAPAKTYRWLRCENQVMAASAFQPANCAVIPKAVGENYVLTLSDVSKYIALELTLTNRLGKVVRFTASTLQIQQLPEITGNLTISGKQWLGKTLQAGSYGVTAFPAASPSIQWFRGDLPIVGAVTDTYVLGEQDVNEVITYEISARNTVGSTTRTSAPSGVVGLPPRLLLGSAPLVCGLEGDSEVGAGARVWACPGFWQAVPDVITYTYQWYLCKLPHAATPNVIHPDCTLVKKQTGPEYLISFKDETKFVAYSVTISNGTEDRVWFSATSARIYVKPKYLTGAKTLFATGQAAKDGSPRVGYSIEANLGTWRGTTTNVYSYQWFACTAAVTQSLTVLKSKCEEIFRADGSAKSRSLTITSDLAGKFLGVQIKGAYKYNAETDDPDSSNLDEVFTASTSKAVVEPPVNVTPPRIQSRYPYVQATLTATEGTWRGTPKLTQSKSWWVCEDQILLPTTTQPANCSVLPASKGDWKITLAQKDKFLTQAVTSSNAAGETTMWSASTFEPVSTGPVNTLSPVVTVVGAKFPSTLSDLSVSDGSWVGDPTPVLGNYSWFRCDVAVAVASEFRDSSCALIEQNASGKTYRPVLADAGKFIVAAVTFSNGHDWVAYSASTTVVNLPPNNLVAPSVEGDPFVGRAIVSKVGTWDGSPAPTYENQWFSCATRSLLPVLETPSDCLVIAKATGESFTPTVAQLDRYLMVRVVGTNVVGNKTAWSNFTDAVVSGPVLITEPTFTYPATRANPIVGAGVSTDGGIWQGTPAPTKSYEWLACDVAVTAGSETAPAESSACSVIENSASSTITPTEQVRGKFLMVHVQGVNRHGVADWYSSTTSVVWMAPVIDQPVQVFGTIFNELNAKAKFDTWKAFPAVTREYVWYLCTDLTLTAQNTLPSTCEPITPAATNATFKIPNAPWNENKRLAVRVVATNALGSATIYSATSAPIKPGPVNKVPPVVSGVSNFALSGTAQVSATAGVWSPEDALNSFQWYRCPKLLNLDDELGEDCEVIPGANTASYTLTADDPGNSLVAAVKGENAIGASVIYSKSTALITERVNNVQAPQVVGLPKVETSVSGTDGVWRGFPSPTPSIKRAWFVCSARQVAKVGTKPAGCNALPNTNRKTFTIPDAANIIGKYLVFAVTQSNKVGGVDTKVTAYSASTEMVADPPVISVAATLKPPAGFGTSDRPSVGTAWTISATWKKPFPPVTYQWYTCTNRVASAPTSLEVVPADCVQISGVNTASYTIRLADRGKYLLGAATGTNAAGSETSFTRSSADPVDQPPTADPLPIVSGERSGGQTLSVTSGTWSPVGTVVSYRWYACDSAIASTVSEIPTNCTKLDGTTSSYVQSEDFDGGKYITAFVIGKFGKATTGYLIAVTAGTRVGPSISEGNSKPYLDYDSFLIGNLFTVVTGQWEGIPEPVKTYRWYRCDSASANASTTLPPSLGCVLIPGATDVGYQATTADDGKFLIASETGTNESGATTYYTASSEDPMYAGFEPTSLVSVSATSLEIKPGQAVTITKTPGQWAKPGLGSAVLVHRWVYCNAPVSTVGQRFPTGCSTMFPLRAGRLVAVEDTQPLVLSMDTPFAGYYIGSVEYVQKANSPLNVDNPANRETFRLSATTAQVKIAPTLWNAAVTTELHSTAGGNGYQEPKITRQAIAGVPLGALQAVVGVPLVLEQVSAWQADTDPFSERVLKKVTWRGVGNAVGEFSHQWFRCERLLGVVSTTLPAGCLSISGATASTYTPVVQDIGAYLSLRVTATNSVGSSSAWTKSSWHVTQKATNVAGGEPTLSPISLTGESATVSPGDWAGEPAPTLTYSWYLCPTPTFVAWNCRYYDGSGRSFTVVTLGGRDRERYLVAGVTGSNYPYLTSDTTPGFILSESVAYASSSRIYEAPYWSNGIVDGSGVTLPVTIFAGNTSNVGNNLSANVGETFRMDAGVEKWNATPSVTSDSFTYSWFTCSTQKRGVSREAAAPADCSQIEGQTENLLTIDESLIGKRVMGRVQTSNQHGVGYSYTATSEPITQKPYNITPPTMNFGAESAPVKGKPIIGQPGTWGGSPSPSAEATSYRWYSCNTAVSASANLQSGCVQLAAATSSVYYPTPQDRGKYIVYSLETRNYVNPLPTTAATRHFSAGAGPVLMDPEFDATDPQINGAAHVGQTLSLAAPNVTSYPDATTTWDWYSCTTTSSNQNLTSIPAGCVKVGVANQTRLTLDDSYVGKFIAVFASSVSRTAPTKKNSLFTSAVTKEPTNTVAPSITGTLVADGTNSVTPVRGTWSATPSVTSGLFSWFLCTELVPTAGKLKPSSCEATPLSTQSNTSSTPLLLSREMAGKHLVLAETATQSRNNLGSNTSVTHYSASTAVIKSPPAFQINPSISGDFHTGEIITSSFTRKAAFDLDQVAYQWYSCTSAVTSATSLTGLGCLAVNGAESVMFIPATSQAGKYLSVGVTLTNSVGTVTRFANSTAQAISMTPTNSSPVTISGGTTVSAGAKLTAADGTWISSPAATKTYLWYLCDSAQTSAASSIPQGCVLARTSTGANASGKSLDLISDYRGKHLIVGEKATSAVNKLGAGEATSFSTSLGPIRMAPQFSDTPTVSGFAHVGEILNATIPAVISFPAATSTYEWLSCSSALSTAATSVPANCVTIGRSQSSALTLSANEAGKFVAVLATNTNELGTAIRSSVVTVAVTSTPVNTLSPVLSGDPVVASGSFVAVNQGTWNSSPAVTIADYSYGWFACTTEQQQSPSALPNDCVQIPNATASSITPTDDLAGKHLLARVTVNVRSNKTNAGVGVAFTATSGKVRNKPQFGAMSPTVSGTPHLGETLTATLAQVTGFENPSSSYAWWQCVSAVPAGTADVSSFCEVIPGSANSAFVISASQVGKRVVLVQTATNQQGSVSRSSASSLLVSATPTVSQDPVISGATVFAANATVSVTKGIWEGSPAPAGGTYGYTWYLCSSLTAASDNLHPDCTLITPVGTTTNFSGINLSANMDGKYLVARETISTTTNKPNTGVARRYSAGFGPISVAPTVSADPTTSATVVATGNRLRANLGTWVSNTRPITYAYQWFNCSTAISTAQSSVPSPNCSVIAGADSSDLVVPNSSSGKYILLAVTATNAGGSVLRTSRTTNLVTATPANIARLGWLR